MGLFGEMGIGGRVAFFLKAVYMNVSGEVKVGEVCSKPFPPYPALYFMYVYQEGG